MPNQVHYTYSNIESFVRSLQKQIDRDGFKPDIIVGLCRGGLLPATLLSHMTNTPMYAINLSTRDFPEISSTDCNWIKDVVAKGKKVLIVDDICDSGSTLRELMDSWSLSCEPQKIDWYNTFRIAVIDYKLESKFKVNYKINTIPDNTWVVYPYEVN